MRYYIVVSIENKKMSVESVEVADTERGPETIHLSRDVIDELSNMLTEKAGRLTESQARRAAGLSVQMLGQGLTTDPSELPTLTGYRSPIEGIAEAASEVHRHLTGQPLPYGRGDGSPYDVALGQLSGAWDEMENPSVGNDPHVSEFAVRVAEEALRGLSGMSYDSKPATVSPQTYNEFRYTLGGEA